MAANYPPRAQRCPRTEWLLWYAGPRSASASGLELIPPVALTCVPGKSARSCHHRTIRGDRDLQRNTSCRELKIRVRGLLLVAILCRPPRPRCALSSAPMSGCRRVTRNGTRSRRFLNVSCVWRRCSHNHGAQRCNIAWSARVARRALRDETSHCSIDKPVFGRRGKDGPTPCGQEDSMP
jgi:hypothetical protein